MSGFLVTLYKDLPKDVVLEVFESCGKDAKKAMVVLDDMKLGTLQTKTESEIPVHQGGLKRLNTTELARHDSLCVQLKEIRKEQPHQQPTFFENASTVSTLLKRKASMARKKIAEKETETPLGVAYTLDERRVLLRKGSVSSLARAHLGLGSECGREDAIVKGKEALSKRLFALHLKQVPMEDDGNCLFRAFGHQLFGHQDAASETRLKCCFQLSKKDALYPFYFDNQQEYQEYVEKMRKDGCWGDEIALKALVDAYDVVVFVLLSTPGNWYLRYVPENRDPLKSHKIPKIFLSYLSPVHYDSLVHKDGGTVKITPDELRDFPDMKDASSK